jgi:lysine-specific histone demethylase 1
MMVEADPLVKLSPGLASGGKIEGNGSGNGSTEMATAAAAAGAPVAVVLGLMRSSASKGDTVTGTTSTEKKKRKRKLAEARRGAAAAAAASMTPESGEGGAGAGTTGGTPRSMRTLRQQARAPTYDENALDAAFDDELESAGASLTTKGRKKKPLSVEKEVDVEAMIASSIGFPRDALTEEEIEAGVVSTVGGLEQANYIVVRNHILAKWRENVNAWLDQDTVMESIRSQHKSLVSAAYKFLLTFGYINFGVAPAIKARIPVEATKATVIVIGAGLAGVAAARQLMAFGYRVVVVEGRQRPGGRVYTKKMEGDGLVAAADLGGSVVTGIHGNPLGVLARQLGFPLHKIREKCPLYQPNGLPVKEESDAKVEQQFNKLLDRASKWREEMETVADSISLGATLETLRVNAKVAEVPEERQLLDWHLANLEYANAGLLSNLSLAFWDQDDPYEMGGDHVFLPGGNVRLVSALAEGVPIFYGKTVHSIAYGSEGVKVVAGDKVFEGDMALCTVPLGVLKRGSIKFEPELPQRKLDAIKRLGFGLLNKVVMLFPHAFWGADLDTFGHLGHFPNTRGEFFLFYSYAAVSGGPLLLALVAGEAAIHFESMPPLEAVTRVLAVLRGGFCS